MEVSRLYPEKNRKGDNLEHFMTGFSLRSLQDFYWLEQAMPAEFFGGLLLPSLSIYLGASDIRKCQHKVVPCVSSLNSGR